MQVPHNVMSNCIIEQSWTIRNFEVLHYIYVCTHGLTPYPFFTLCETWPKHETTGHVCCRWCILLCNRILVVYITYSIKAEWTNSYRNNKHWGLLFVAVLEWICRCFYKHYAALPINYAESSKDEFEQFCPGKEWKAVQGCGIHHGGPTSCDLLMPSCCHGLR